ncbi:MAG TPA: hypothetical protein VM450_17085, partial [Thermomicrobiales bacterium]|nr:hypothetical protein [Thermomicrobiales bacterium]
LTLGMDESLPVFFSGSVAFSPRLDGHSTVPARYAEHDLLLSGWIHGEKHICGEAAIVDVTVGDGTFTGIGFRPHFRAQTPTGYNVLVNALLRPGLAAARPTLRRDGTPS